MTTHSACRLTTTAPQLFQPTDFQRDRIRLQVQMDAGGMADLLENDPHVVCRRPQPDETAFPIPRQSQAERGTPELRRSWEIVCPAIDDEIAKPASVHGGLRWIRESTP